MHKHVKSRVKCQWKIKYCQHLKVMKHEMIRMMVNKHLQTLPNISFDLHVESGFNRVRGSLLLRSCCPYLYFGSAIMLMTYFVNFR